MAKGYIATATGKILMWGTILSLVVFGLLFAAMNQPQCPESYTQAQVDASNCIIGANIGIGLLVISFPLLWAISVFVAKLFFNNRRPRNKKP